MNSRAALFTVLMALACEKTGPAQVDESLLVANEKAPTSPPPWATRRSSDSGFPCDVERVLAASCRRCHWQPQENDAPFSLAKWSDTQMVRSGKPIHVLMSQMVEADLMPPLDALVEPAVEPLSESQKATLLAWLKHGAARSDEKCAP